MTNATITFQLNGRDTLVESETTVEKFLEAKGFRDQLVVVEVNGTILPRSEFAEKLIRESDRIEIVHFVGGG